MKPSMFIASSTEALPVAHSIQQLLEHDVYATVWSQGAFQLSSYPVEDLLNTVSNSDFGVFVFSPDDVTRLRHRQHDTVRDNVIFELGLFIGRLGRERNFFVVPRGIDKLHIPTDLLGLNAGTYDPAR